MPKNTSPTVFFKHQCLRDSITVNSNRSYPHLREPKLERRETADIRAAKRTVGGVR